MHEPKKTPQFYLQSLGPHSFTAAIVAIISIKLLADSALNSSLAFVFLYKQDVWLILTGMLVLGACAVTARRHTDLPAWKPPALWLGGGAMAVLVWLGHRVVLLGYDMSRDEQLAGFDARIFASGHLVAPLHASWSEYADALNTTFMLSVSDRSAWVSGYLPGNAAIRALFETAGAASLVGPLAVLIGGLALWGCARKIWPQDRSAASLAALLYFTSGQVLLNGMSSYAMPLHLAANLVWLWLFLQNRLRQDLLALCIAFVAVGLHQPLFHPMFAFPLLLGVVLERNWLRSGVFLAGYLLIGAFWFWWPLYSASLTGSPLPGGNAGYLTRLSLALSQGEEGGLLKMIANLVRFVAWQNLALIPLLVIGVRHLAHDRLMAALAASLALTIIVMTVILPYQGHGFGYRYLHGLIGNAILLAVSGWRIVRAQSPRWNSLVVRASLFGTLVLLPMQLTFAQSFYAPYAAASRAIDALGTDYVLIQGKGAPFAQDLVINDPYLAHRPIRLLQEYTTPSLLRAICRDGASVGQLPAAYYGRIQDYYTRSDVSGHLDKRKLTSTRLAKVCKLQ